MPGHMTSEQCAMPLGGPLYPVATTWLRVLVKMHPTALREQLAREAAIMANPIM